MLTPPDLTKPAFDLFPSAADKVMRGECVTCPNDINFDEFRNELSVKEFGISGMCQDCQDQVFGK